LGQPTVIGPAWALLLLVAYPLVMAVSRPRRVAASILLGYAMAVTAITVFPIVVHPWRRGGEPWWAVVQLVPFNGQYLSFLLNIVMFLPFGVLVPLLCSDGPPWVPVRRIAVWSLCASAAIEGTQLLLWTLLGSHRTVDVNDLIANTAGGVLGLLALRRATRARQPQDDVQARM
jgi:glycopeptide antibiotics resistance protein